VIEYCRCQIFRIFSVSSASFNCFMGMFMSTLNMLFFSECGWWLVMSYYYLHSCFIKICMWHSLWRFSLRLLNLLSDDHLNLTPVFCWLCLGLGSLSFRQEHYSLTNGDSSCLGAMLAASNSYNRLIFSRHRAAEEVNKSDDKNKPRTIQKENSRNSKK